VASQIDISADQRPHQSARLSQPRAIRAACGRGRWSERATLPKWQIAAQYAEARIAESPRHRYQQRSIRVRASPMRQYESGAARRGRMMEVPLDRTARNYFQPETHFGRITKCAEASRFSVAQPTPFHPRRSPPRRTARETEILLRRMIGRTPVRMPDLQPGPTPDLQ
jgi:hypothetical protein